AILVKLTAVLAIPAVFVLAKPEKKSLTSKILAVSSIVLPVLGALSIYAWYNYARFGDVLATGYNMSGRAAELGGNGIGNPIIGFLGLIVSPGRGLIWYAPPVVVASLGYRSFSQKHKLASISFAFLAASWIALHSAYQGWDSGWGWGPRYLLPILPILLVPTVESLRLRKGKIICLALVVAGFLVQLPGALVDFMTSGRAGMNLFAQTAPVRNATAFVNWRNFHPSGSEIVRHFA